MLKIFKKIDSENYGISLTWVVFIVIGISASLVILSFSIFLNSGAYDTVKQISAASSTLAKDDLEGYDTTSPIRADILNNYSKNLDEKVDGLDDQEDFSDSFLDETSLGY
jgi:hypothetical protein